MTTSLKVSVVVPVTQRVDNLEELYRSYRAALEACGLSFEFLFVLDGGAFEAEDALAKLGAGLADVRVLKLSKYFGEATVLSAGFENAAGELILTLPAYHQIEATEISRLFEEIQTCDMVLARRWPRAGSLFERVRRRVFHLMLRALSGEDYSDLGCGVRLFKRQIAGEVSLYGDLHRFLPVLASRQGFNVKEIDIRQSPNDIFRGSYRIREYLHRILDITTVFFLVRFTKKPLRFFGMIGGTAAGIGGLAVLVTVVQRLFFDVALADRPALLLGSLLLVLGVQTIALGLIGELIIFTHAGALKEYKVAEIINERPKSSETSVVGTRNASCGN